MKKSKTAWRIVKTACLLFITAIALGVEFCYRWIVLPKGYLWLFDWMETAILAAGAFAFAAAVILNLKKKPGTKAAWLAAAGVTAVLATAFSAVLSPGKEEVSWSPEKSRLAVVDTDAQSGQRRLCRVSHIFFRYPKEILPFAADSDLKYDWLEEDVCAVTGRDTAGKVRQYLATYGARGSITSYMDPYGPMRGSWTGYDSSGKEWSVTVSSGISIVTEAEQWFFEESDCERYGTIGMTLGEAFSLIMNRDCYEEDGMLMDGGTLTLCRISMDEQEKLLLEKTGEAEGWADYSEADTAPEEPKEPVEIDHKTETDSAGAIWAPYDYPRMPYEKDGSIYVLCGQGADGDYNGGDQNETARYRSEDHGHTFVFDGMEPTE